MSGRPLAASLALAFTLAGCGTGEKREREKQRAASWVASAREAAAGWRAHTLSTVFARDVAGRAAEEIGGAREKLPAGARAAAGDAVSQLKALRVELGRRDDAAVVARDASLARIESALRGAP